MAKSSVIGMNVQIIEEMSKFKYGSITLCKRAIMERETRERALQGRAIIGTLGCIMKGRTVGMEEKKSNIRLQ